MDKLFLLFILIFINICIKNKKNNMEKDTKEIKHCVNLKKITYADEEEHNYNIHHEHELHECCYDNDFD